MRTGRNQDGNVDNLVLISNKDSDLIFWYNVTFAENLQGHFQEILPHLLYCFLLFSCFIHIHTHTSFFPPESFVICRHNRFFYTRALVRISPKRKHSYITVLHLSKSCNLTLVQSIIWSTVHIQFLPTVPIIPYLWFGEDFVFLVGDPIQNHTL